MDAVGASLQSEREIIMAKDTQKALLIIFLALMVLMGLLIWANSVRPHA